VGAAVVRQGNGVAMISLADYPNIKLLFWSVPGLHDVDEEMLYSALEDNNGTVSTSR